MPDKTLIFKLFSTIKVMLKKLPDSPNELQLAKPVMASATLLKRQLKRLFNIPDYILNCIKAPYTTIKKLFVKDEIESTELSVDLDLSEYFKVDFITFKEASLNIKTNKKIVRKE